MNDEYDNYINEESEEFSYQDFKQTADKNAAHWQRWQHEKSQETALAEQGKIFADALKDVDLTQAQFNELVALDPQATQADFKEGVKDYVSKVASRARDSRGRFTPGKPQPQYGQNVQQRREQAQQSGPTIAELKERAGRGKQVSDEDVINALFPDPLY